jgi:hypothetical protein
MNWIAVQIRICSFKIHCTALEAFGARVDLADLILLVSVVGFKIISDLLQSVQCLSRLTQQIFDVSDLAS